MKLKIKSDIKLYRVFKNATIKNCRYDFEKKFMAKRGRKRNKQKEKEPEKERHLKEETVHMVLAVVCVAISLLFMLSALSLAGIVGDKIFSSLSSLFGIGYFLFPVLSLMLAISLVKSLAPTFNPPRVVGSFLFFTSGLAIIDIVLPGKGGVVGQLLSSPLMKLFDTYASLLLLWTLFIVSTLIILDARPSLSNLMFWKKEEDVDEDEDEDMAIPEPITSEEKPEDEEENKKPEPPKKDTEEKDSGEGIFKDLLGKGGFFGGKEGAYTPPPISLLESYSGKPGAGDIKANANIIRRTLNNFGITVEMDEISIGPSVTRYALKPAEGVRLSKILSLQNNLELALAAHPVRIEAPIPGKSLVGIEVPNSSKATVGLASLIKSKEFKSTPKPLTIALGKGISGTSYMTDISKAPHLLIAGATGSGKSVTIHTLVTSLLYRNSPEHLKFIMVDPKRVELTLYNGIPHLLTPVITDAKKAILALKWTTQEMEKRYDILQENKVRDIASYHKNVLEPALKKEEGSDDDTEEPYRMPYIVIIIDELADIMQSYPRELEAGIVRLAQMSRAVGIHLVLSTQRPSVNVITGLIKANIPARIALQVASQIDSRTILDASGAEKLLGAGDMLYLSGEMSKPVRIQSAFISEEEVKKVTKFLKKQYEDVLEDDIVMTDDESSASSIFDASLDDEEDDELYEEARETVIEAGKASTSYLQRKLRVGYARAARLMDILEDHGVVGPQDGSKPRDILVDEPPADESDTNETNQNQ